MFNSDGMHLLDVAQARDRLVITVEIDAVVTGCPVCGVVATGHKQCRMQAADTPCFGMVVQILCLERVLALR